MLAERDGSGFFFFCFGVLKGDQISLTKNAQTVVKSIFCQIRRTSLTVEIELWPTFVIFKHLPKENNHPMCENSPQSGHPGVLAQTKLEKWMWGSQHKIPRRKKLARCGLNFSSVPARQGDQMSF
jgi:hypothetical protein